MVVYHTRYRKDWERQTTWGDLSESICIVVISSINHPSTKVPSLGHYQLTLSVNTTPNFHTWYLVSIELNLATEKSWYEWFVFSVWPLLLAHFISGPSALFIRLISHHDTSEASLATVSSVGLKSRALLSKPSSSAILSAPYRSPYFLITYERQEQRRRPHCYTDI